MHHRRPHLDLTRPVQRATRVLCYSHDSYGLGHLRRSVTLATAMVARSSHVQALCLTGSPVPDLFRLPERCDLIKLPSISKDEQGRYVPRKLGLGLNGVTSMRSELITATVRAFRPDVLLIDHTFTGPGDELLPVLQRLRHEHMPTRVVLGMRDVLDSPMRARAELHRQRAFEVIDRFYDEVLVYGDREIFDPMSEYGYPDSIAQKTTFTGPVVPASMHGRRERDRNPTPRLLVTAGGGEDGYELLRGTVAALRGPMRRDELAVDVVAGPLMPERSYADLLRAVQGDERITLRQCSDSMQSLMDQADLVVGMGGYNTVYETLARGVPLLTLPRRKPREEQWERCRRLQERGLVELFGADDLADPHATAGAIRRALAAGPGPRPPLACDGATRAAEQCLRVQRMCHSDAPTARLGG